MTLIRYNPNRETRVWRPFADLQSEINRLFSDALSTQPTAAAYVPPVDVFEKDKSIVVRADLPGLKREDIHVSLHEGVLTIRGKREHQEQIKEEGFTYTERSMGTFARSIQLPADVDRDKVNASYVDGVLTIEAPKSEAALPRTVEVNVN